MSQYVVKGPCSALRIWRVTLTTSSSHLPTRDIRCYTLPNLSDLPISPFPNITRIFSFTHLPRHFTIPICNMANIATPDHCVADFCLVPVSNP